MTRKLLCMLVALVLVLTALPFAMAEDAPVSVSVAGYMYGPIDDAKDVITPAVEKMLLEKHGINVDINVEYIEYANYTEILAPRLAGGTAPDVFLAMSNLNAYYDQGVIASWDVDFFKENAPDVWAFVENGGVNGDLASQFDMWLVNAKKDGKMVVVPSLKPDGNMPYKTLIYRGDWIENLGVEDLPKTVDEYVDLLYSFTQDDPDGNGANDTYGCNLTGMKALFGAYGMYNGAFNGDTSYWYIDENGAVVNPDVSEKSKAVLEILAQLYADGVIDPEFVKGKESADGAYWAASYGLINGLYGASANASIDHFRLKEVLGDNGGPVAQTYWEVNGPDAEFVYAPWPAGPDGDYGWCVGFAVATSESAVYNKALENDTDKLATIFQILNAFATDDELYMLAAYGIEGVHYDMVDGKPIRNANLTNADLNEVGVWGCRSLYGADRAFSELAYNLVFYNDASIANRLNYFKLDQYNSYIQNAIDTTLPSAGDLLSDLNTLRDETYTAIVTGVKTIDDWDAYVAEYMARGGQTLADEAAEYLASK